MPKNLSSALRLLELAMEAVPLDQIDFLRFNAVAREIERIESDKAKGDIYLGTSFFLYTAPDPFMLCFLVSFGIGTFLEEESSPLVQIQSPYLGRD